jgi:serine/threonine protein kinase
MNNIRTQTISFTSTIYIIKIIDPIWNKRSKESKKLVLQMLNKDYNERISAYDVLNS